MKQRKLLFLVGSFPPGHLQIIELAAKHRMPVIYANRLVAEAGGMLADGPELSELAERMAAATLDLTIPQAVLTQADEVTE